MNKIIINHSHICINDYKLGDKPYLENMFSIWDPVYFKKRYIGIIYKEEEKQLIIPRGFPVGILESTFKEKAYLNRNCISPIYFKSLLQLKFKPRNNTQKEIIKFLVGEYQYKSNQTKSALSLNASTGVGKSYCSIVSSCIENTRTIVIASRVNWLIQWKNYLFEYTNIMNSEVYELIGSSKIDRIMNRGLEDKVRFIVASHDTISSYASNYGWNKIAELFNIIKPGIVIYDEAHLNFDNICRINAYINVKKTYYLTATPGKSDEIEDQIYMKCFETIPAINLFDEDKDPHAHYIKFTYNTRPTPIDIQNCFNGYGFNKNAYADYVIKKKEFYQMLRLCINIIKSKGKSVIYIAKLSAINVVYDWIIENYPEYKNNVGVYTSEIKENRREQLNNLIILSTMKSLGTAEDVRGLKCVFVLAEPFKSKILTVQSFGRLRDKDTFYFDIVDEGFSSIRKYANQKKPLFNKYSVDMSIEKFDKDKLENMANKIENNRKDYVYQYPKENIVDIIEDNVSPVYIGKQIIPVFKI